MQLAHAKTKVKSHLMTVKYRRLSEVPQPEYKTNGSAGFDLSVVNDTSDSRIRIQHGDFRIVSTGLVIATPEKHFLMLTPRSSLFKKHGLILVNSPGIVDSDYCGNADEIKLAFYNPTQNDAYLVANERVAQGLFVPYVEALWQEVDTLEGENRGGFGSTG